MMAQPSNAAAGAGHVGLELPEDIVGCILDLLPPLSILRSRATCKLWFRLSSNRDFLLAHHLRQPTLPLLRSECNLSDEDKDEDEDAFLMALYYYCLEAVDLRAVLPRRMVVRFKDVESIQFNTLAVHGSCDGLLLLGYLKDHFVCNPATRRWVRLPPLPPDNCCIAGFYAHAASGEYRVLFLRRDDDEMEWEYCVLTVGSQQPERRIARRASSGSLAEAQAAGALRECSQTMPPVLLHGSLHWPLQQLQVNMRVFDTVAESFRWMRPPRGIRRYSRCFLFRTEEGKLALSSWDWDQDQSTAEFWVMDDYESETWALSYRIQVPFVGEGMPLYVTFVSQDGDMLVDSKDKVLHYDKNGSLLQTFRCDGPEIFFSRHFLKESLVQHPFLRRQQDDDDSEGLPFFKGIQISW